MVAIAGGLVMQWNIDMPNHGGKKFSQFWRLVAVRWYTGSTELVLAGRCRVVTRQLVVTDVGIGVGKRVEVEGRGVPDTMHYNSVSQTNLFRVIAISGKMEKVWQSYY